MIIVSSHKSDFFSTKRPILLHTSTTCTELPFNINNMGMGDNLHYFIIPFIMVLILDGNSEHAARAGRRIGLFVEK